MPRAVTLWVAPASRHTSCTAGSPTAPRQRLVARLPDRTIIWRARARSVLVPPSSAQVAESLSSAGSLA